MILVTGGTGYLGRALVGRLVEEGESVRVLSRRLGDIAAELQYGDVTSPAQLDEAMQGVNVVYHLAALVDHYAPPEELYRVNVQGTLNVIDAAMRQGVERIVHCSSVSAEPGGGSTAYGRSKIEAERVLRDWQGKIPIITLRPGPVYDEERKNLRRLVRFARLTRVSPRLTPDVMLHLASRRNVVDALLLARNAGIPGRAYAICDRHPVRRSQLAEIIRREADAVAFPVPLPLIYPMLYGAAIACEGLDRVFAMRPVIDRHYLKVLMRSRGYDITMAVNDLGFVPAETEAHFTRAVRACLAR